MSNARRSVRYSAGPTAEGFAHTYESAGTPAGTVTMEDPATLKVFYDPVRYEILKALDEPKSVKEIADELGETANRLYYHVRLLERHGLVTVADQRIAGSNIERLYSRAGSRYLVAAGLESEAFPMMKSATAPGVDAMFSDFARMLTDPDRSDEVLTANGIDPGSVDATIVAAQGGDGARMTPTRFKELADRLRSLFDEYFGEDAPMPPDGEPAFPVAALLVLTPGQTKEHP